MNAKENGQALAFPFVETREMQGESISFGLSKREIFAKAALQGLAPEIQTGAACDHAHRVMRIAGYAVELADALLVQLAKGSRA